MFAGPMAPRWRRTCSSALAAPCRPRGPRPRQCGGHVRRPHGPAVARDRGGHPPIATSSAWRTCSATLRATCPFRHMIKNSLLNVESRELASKRLLGLKFILKSLLHMSRRTARPCALRCRGRSLSRNQHAGRDPKPTNMSAVLPRSRATAGPSDPRAGEHVRPAQQLARGATPPPPRRQRPAAWSNSSRAEQRRRGPEQQLARLPRRATRSDTAARGLSLQTYEKVRTSS